jgi:DNA-nicking Smr family endonuclease
VGGLALPTEPSDEAKFLASALGGDLSLHEVQEAIDSCDGDVELACMSILQRQKTDQEEVIEINDDDDDNDDDTEGQEAHEASESRFPDILGMERAQRQLSRMSDLPLAESYEHFSWLTEDDMVASALAIGALSEEEAELVFSALRKPMEEEPAAPDYDGGLAELQSLLVAMDAEEVKRAWDASGGDEATAREILRAGYPEEMATAEQLEREAATGDSGRLLALQRLLFAMDEDEVERAWYGCGGDEATTREILRAMHPEEMTTAENLEREAIRAGAIPPDGSRELQVGPGGSLGPVSEGGAVVALKDVWLIPKGRKKRGRLTRLPASAADAVKSTVADPYSRAGVHVGERRGVAGSATFQGDVLRMATTAGTVGTEEAMRAAPSMLPGGAFVGASVASSSSPSAAVDGSWTLVGAAPSATGPAAMGHGALTAEEALASSEFHAAQHEVWALSRLRAMALHAACLSRKAGKAEDAAVQAERARKFSERMQAAQRTAANTVLRLRNTPNLSSGRIAASMVQAHTDLANAIARGADVQETVRAAGIRQLVFVNGRAIVPERGQVDLHGQLPEQGVRLLRDVILPAARRDRVKAFTVVTGRGAHSRGGRSRLREAVESFLRASSEVSFSSSTDSTFTVRLR